MSEPIHYTIKDEAPGSDQQTVNDLLKGNGDSCRNCIYQAYDRENDLCYCYRYIGKKCVASDTDGDCSNIIKRYEPDENLSMLAELMQRTGTDAEELFLYLGIGSSRAAEFAALDGSDELLKRSITLRDAVKDIMIGKEHKNR